jgi:hypothetical protein
MIRKRYESQRDFFHNVVSNDDNFVWASQFALVLGIEGVGVDEKLSCWNDTMRLTVGEGIIVIYISYTNLNAKSRTMSTGADHALSHPRETSVS